MVAQAETLSRTEIVPREFRNRPDDIIAVSLIGREMGLSPMLAMQYIHVIEGRPSVKPELMNARIRAAGHRIEVGEWTHESCTLKGTRSDGESMTVTFTMADAQRAGLVKAKGNWERFPKAMLWARALSMLARALFPDVIIGASYVPEELGAQVDEDGVPTGATDAPSSVLADEHREAMAEAVDATDVEVIDPEDDGEEYVQAKPPPPLTPAQQHAKDARDLFAKGWPMGRCKGEDPLDPDKVDTGSLEYMAGLPIKDDKWKDTEVKRRAWIDAEIARRSRIAAGNVPSAEDMREAARQPKAAETHADLNEAAAQAAAAEDDEYADIPFGRDGGPVETAATSSDFAPTEATPEFPPAEDPADALTAPLNGTWHNRMIDAMVEYGYATDATDAAARILAIAKRKAEAGESKPLNSWAAGQIEAFRKNPGPGARARA